MTARMTAAQFRAMPQGRQPTIGPNRPRGNSMYALGRLPPQVMNKTEARYLAEVITPLMQSGELVWWAFDAIKLRIAPDCFLTVDFAQMRADGTIELVDVKGAAHIITDDAKVKTKVAATIFPLAFFYAWPMGGTTRTTKGWHIEQVGR